MISNVSIEINEAAIRNVEEVLRSGYLVQGPKVEEFERAFADYCGVEHAVAVANGTCGLHLALLGLGVEEGDEVITSPFTFIATGTSVLFTGAAPVFADIDPRTFNIDPDRVEEAITERTKAIMPVHLYGQSADMTRIGEIAEEHDLKVLEDACQAHGAEHRGRKVGGLGNAGVFSFYPTKNMTTGEGGIITTGDTELAERLRLLRNHGQKTRYFHILRGYNYRMTDIAAALGIAELKELEKRTQKRIFNAEYLTDSLKGSVEIPYVSPNNRHVFHQYTVKTDARESVRRTLEEREIGYGIYYPKPIPAHKPFREYSGCNIPVTERMIHRVISLPIHHNLSREDLDAVAEAVVEGVG